MESLDTIIYPNEPITFSWSEEQLMAAPLRPGEYAYRIINYEADIADYGQEYIRVVSEIEARKVITIFFADKGRYHKDKLFYYAFLESISDVQPDEYIALRRKPMDNPPFYFIGRSGRAEIKLRGRKSLNYVRYWMPSKQ